MEIKENSLEKSKIPLSIEEIRACHNKIQSGICTNIDSVISQLIPYYLTLPLKSPLKRPLRLLLKDADIHTSLLPYLSEVVTEKAASLSDDLFIAVEECVENLPGGLKCIENEFHVILTGMNSLFLNDTSQHSTLLPRLKSYHKTIVKCQSFLQECVSTRASVTREYNFVRENLINLSRGRRLSDLNEQASSELFGGVARLMYSEGEDASQTAISVVVLLLRLLDGKNEFLQHIEVIFNSIKAKVHVHNLRIILGIFYASPSEVIYLTPNNAECPLFVTLTEMVRTSLATEQQVRPRLLLCRCLHSCIVALSRSAADSACKAILLQYIAATNGIMETVVGIIMNNWDSYSELIRHLIKSVFEEFLALLSRVLASESQTCFEELANSFLVLDVKLTTKYKYLSLLSNYIPLHRWIALDALLPDTLLSVMDENALATHAGEFWSRLVNQENLEFSDIQPWIDSLLSTIPRVGDRHAQNIHDYCKRGLISSHPDILQYIAGHTPATDQGLLFLVQCHKQAQKQLVHCEVALHLSSEQLNFSLKTSSPDLSLSVLEFISKSHKSTAVVSEDDLSLILRGFALLISTDSASCRKNLISILKVLIDRMEKSARKYIQHRNLDENRFSSCCISYYSDFLSKFSSLLFAYLNPGSSFGVIEVALTLFPPMLLLYSSTPQLFPADFSINDLNLERLLSVLKDTYESHCRMALDSLLILKDRLLLWLGDSNYSLILDEMFSLMLSPVSVHSISASYYLRLLFTIDPNRLHDSIRKKYPQITPDLYTKENLAPIQIDCLLVLMELLALQLSASQDQWDPIRNSFYPILRCIRRLLLDENSVVSCPTSILQYSFDKLTLMCTRVLAITGPIVCSSSPEGLLQPPDTRVDEVDVLPSDSRALLLCSWQSLKEISLLYSEIVELIIPTTLSLSDSVIMDRVYEFFLNYLMEARHRGAFELTYSGFLKLCRVVWLSSTTRVNRLPSIWLESVLNSLSSKESVATQLMLLSCATRRSAGLPFLVLAILANEPQHLNNKHLLLTMDTLSLLAANTPHSSEDIIVQVHCLNIMRALFKDNKLRDSMHQFVAAAIKLVISCVVSRHWPIRNASHLLFSSILSRVFGVKRIQDEHAWQNKLTLNSFFTRYSNLLEIFIQKLNNSARNSCEIQSDYSVFIILTILSRLYISKSEAGSPSENVFVLPLFSLSENPSWKLREMCAHAICSLLYSHPFSEIFQTFLQHSDNLTNSTPLNRTHGFLLIVKDFIQVRYSQLSVEEAITLFTFCTEFIQNCVTGVANHCLLLQILSAMLSQSSANLITLFETNLDALCSHLSVSCAAIIGDSRLKSWGDNLLMQTQITSNLDLTLTLLSKSDSNQQPNNYNTLVAIVVDFIDRPDTMYYCIRELIDHPVHLFRSSPLLLKLFRLIMTSEQLHVMCVEAMLLIHDYDLEALAHDLSETSLDIKGALNIVLPVKPTAESSLFGSSLHSIIMFSGCLLLALNSQNKIEYTSVTTIIHFMYETVTEFQDPSTLNCISSTASAIYNVIMPHVSDIETLVEWYFLLFSILQQYNIQNSKLSSLIISTYKNNSQISHSEFPQNPHPNILTNLLLEVVSIMYDDVKTINIFLFLFGNFPGESDSGREEERESEIIFEETTHNECNQPDMVLLSIYKSMESLIAASQQVQLLIEAVRLKYEEYDKQELDGDAFKLQWNGRKYINNLKCALLMSILTKWKHCTGIQTLNFDESSNENIHKYLAILPFDIVFS